MSAVLPARITALGRPMIRAVSLFCGVGGFDAGIVSAARSLGVDLHIVAAYDTSAKAVEVYNRNHEPVAIVADVKRLAAEDLPPHDLIFGGPPCQDHSLAGKRGCRCHLGEEPTARCCIRDFVRLSASSPAWLMENVMPLLYPNAPWSERLHAFHFGDATSRKRWFYSSHLLHVVESKWRRVLRDIRDADADCVAVDRSAAVARKKAVEEARQNRSYGFPPRDDDQALASLARDAGLYRATRAQLEHLALEHNSYWQESADAEDDDKTPKLPACCACMEAEAAK